MRWCSHVGLRRHTILVHLPNGCYTTDPHVKSGTIQEVSGCSAVSLEPPYLGDAGGFLENRSKQKFSRACRPVLGKHTDGVLGRPIDLLAVFAYVCGTSAAFSVTTIWLALLKSYSTWLSRITLSIIILLITCAIYACLALHGFKGISILAKICIYYSLDYNTCYSSGVRQDTLSRHWWVHRRMLPAFYRVIYIYGQREKTLFHRITQFITGHTGWFGVAAP